MTSKKTTKKTTAVLYVYVSSANAAWTKKMKTTHGTQSSYINKLIAEDRKSTAKQTTV